MPSVNIYYPRPAGFSQTAWRVLAGQALLAARSVTPVDTGRLKMSWTDPEVTRRSLRMHTDDTAPYASYVQNAECPSGNPSARQLANAGFADRAVHRLEQMAGLLR